jgi:glutamate--cysteine ligase
MFANSPFYEGRATGDKCERAKVWLAVDPDRQGLLPALWKPESGIRDYVEWALEAPMFLFKRNGKAMRNTGQTFRGFWTDGFQGAKPDVHDWEMHLNTLFPEVRLKHTIEVRGGDSQSSLNAPAIPALWTGIFYDRSALDQADALSESFTYDEMEALRPEIAKLGLLAPFRGKRVADVAQRVLSIAKEGLSRRRRISSEGSAPPTRSSGTCRPNRRRSGPRSFAARSCDAAGKVCHRARAGRHDNGVTVRLVARLDENIDKIADF